MSRPTRPADGLRALGVPDEGGAVYELALTHRSFAYEKDDPSGHNERLEFLGDAILEAVVTALIYTTYPDLNEGEMARLRASVVNTEALAEVARDLELGSRIRLGKGEESSGGRNKSSILANVLEAIIGAVLVDRGMAAVEEALVPIFAAKLERAAAAGRYDTKTALQELVVRSTGRLPDYRVAASGPDHDKRFVADVFVREETYGTGTGRSKKEAEQNAAREALERLQREDPTERVLEEGSDARAS